LANQAQAHYRNATHLLPPKPSGWTPVVLSCSSTDGTGMPALWDAIQAYKVQITERGFFDLNRRQQAGYWLREALDNNLKNLFYGHAGVRKALVELEKAVLAQQISPFAAAEKVMAAFQKPE
jgi:LAO/AO transport system kinase